MESDLPERNLDSEDKEEDETNILMKMKSRKSIVLGSDSEEEGHFSANFDHTHEADHKLSVVQKLKLSRLIDSDSESEDLVSNVVDGGNGEGKEKSVLSFSSTLDESDVSQFKLICSRSEDDEEVSLSLNGNGMENETGNSSLLPLDNTKNRENDLSVNNKELYSCDEIIKPTTVKEAEEQRKEIHSESQRRTRQSYVSLPYHKPKQRSIQEFLMKREKITSGLPKQEEPLPIKMSKQQLEQITKQLRKRKEEVTLFYKSESESEDEFTKNEIANETSAVCEIGADEVINDVEENTVSNVPLTSVKNQDIVCHNIPSNETINHVQEIEPRNSKDGKLLLSQPTTDVIELCEVLRKPNVIKQLQKRLFKHTIKDDSTLKTNILEAKVEGVIDGDKKKTGEPKLTLQKLRNELHSVIHQKRIKNLTERENETDKTKDVEKCNEIVENDDANEDDDFESEISESESDCESTEELTKTERNEFLDDEASDDDEIDDENEEEVEENGEQQKEPRVDSQKKLKRIINPIGNDSDKSDEEDEVLPPNQPQSVGTPNNKMTQADAPLNCLSPVINLTGLVNQHFNLEKTPTNTINFETDSSPLFKDASKTQKMLFLESPLPHTSQLPSTQEILSVCSGEFVEMPSGRNEVCSQDVLAMCSGSFTENNNGTESIIQADNTSTTNEKDDVIDDSEQLITQLINEEELEKFKKNFNDSDDKIPEQDETDSENGDYDSLNPSKFRRKRIALLISDDEQSEDEANDDANSEKEEKQVDYDSEENEVVEETNEVDEDHTVAIRYAKEFFENEAELSESDWDSDDEDEKGMDVLEMEMGDEEKFDEQKLRTDLEKIHMRQILDKDTREVKILQELLLEDEMDASTRQRQFKWKNIDANGDMGLKNTSDEEQLDESLTEETDEMWRKKRHERQLFLEKEMKKKESLEQEEDNEETESQVLKLGHTLLQKSLQVTPTETHKVSKTLSPNMNTPFFIRSKRGSFLSRNEATLQKLAVTVKETSTEELVVSKKSIVFQTKNVDENIETKFENETENNINVRKRPGSKAPKNVKRQKRNNDTV